MTRGLSLRLEVFDDAEAAGAAAAEAVAAALSSATRPVLGVATGSSPEPLYRHLARTVTPGVFSDLEVFALDEYVGIDPAHPESYHSVVDRTVSVPLGLDAARVHVPDGSAPDPHAAAARYERAIVAAGGIDVQILGIGGNGHLGFNEPGSPFDSETRVVQLAAETRNANARFFPKEDDVPTHAITQGLATIAAARSLVVIATGEAKAAAVLAMSTGEISVDCPATLLRTHPRAAVFLDRAAARLIPSFEAPDLSERMVMEFHP
ncbi:glucosamine-6-phosphate deaminase [Leifsonia sp. NPDC102414]|uniref:glucosamine-6-phosphate deaminase n=1 Tax=Leifsonia sp. NPDC102414 TaxID=3364124 RepID=UPI0038216C20